MKTIFLLVALGVFVGGCSSGVDVDRFEIKEFHGHTYICYDGQNFDSGLVHDPDCRCGK